MDHKLSKHVKFNEEIDLHYLRGKYNTIFENGVLIPSDEWKPGEPIIEEMRKWIKDPKRSGYDYIYALKNGEIKKVNRFLTTKPRITKDSLTTFILFIVTLCSVAMSAYHTAQAQVNLGKSMLIGWTTGISMILFSGFAFIYVHKIKEHYNSFICFLYILFGISIILYSMFSAYLVGYDKYMIIENEVARSMKNYELNEIVKIQIENQIENIDDSIEMLMAEVEHWKDKSWARRDESFQLLQEAIERKTLLSEKLISENKVEGTEDIVIEATENVFSFLEDLTGIKGKWIKFIVQLLPALFYDVMAPLGLIVLMSRKRNNDE